MKTINKFLFFLVIIFAIGLVGMKLNSEENKVFEMGEPVIVEGVVCIAIGTYMAGENDIKFPHVLVVIYHDYLVSKEESTVYAVKVENVEKFDIKLVDRQNAYNQIFLQMLEMQGR